MTKEESINQLSLVDQIGPLTAKCLYEIGICSPEELASADPLDIVRRWEAKKNEKAPGFSYNASSKSVERWKAAAQLDSWQYSQALERLRLINERAGEKGVECKIHKDAFLDFYGKDKDVSLRVCQYCGISEVEIGKLFAKGQIRTKRSNTRGRSMEIDRKDPGKGYVFHSPDNNNLALCCYWCNNAKTDEFSVDEFLPIAQQIRKVWFERSCS